MDSRNLDNIDSFVKLDKGVFIYMDNSGIFNYQSSIKGSNQNVGDHAKQAVHNNQKPELNDITSELLALLDGVELNTETKQEMEEVINAAVEEASSDKPKKGILKSFLDQTKNVIDTVNKTPALIHAYEKWSGFIKNIIENPPG